VALSPEQPALPAAEAWHPALWRASQLGHRAQAALPTGFAPLDAQLPGGGWPRRALAELLLPHAGVGEMRLLAPVLAALTRSGQRVLWVDPPAAPCAPALEQLGLDVRRLVVVHGRDGAHGGGGLHGSSSPRGRDGAREVHGVRVRRLPGAADVLWALEQALASGELGAVLAWLREPLRADALRRLQLAAQAHDGPVFVFRELAARLRPSAAPLRLALHAAGPDALSVHVLKRRGPALERSVRLELAPVLPPSVRRRAEAASSSAAVARAPEPTVPAARHLA
jgi:protein ImuA